jgi:hypothetical protein
MLYDGLVVCFSLFPVSDRPDGHRPAPTRIAELDFPVNQRGMKPVPPGRSPPPTV